MTLLELAVRGIRHFSGFTRVPLKPGLNTVWGGNQSGKTTLWQVLRQLLVPDRTLTATDDGRQWGHAALTFQGDDGHTYCLARHFSESSERLARHEDGEGFVAMNLPPGERGPVDPQGADEPPLWSACLGGSPWMPSTRLRQGSQALGREQPPALALLGPEEDPEGAGTLQLVPVPDADRQAAAERRLEALGHIERVAREAEDREAELASCYDRRALLRTRLDALSKLERERADTEAELAELEPAATAADEVALAARGYLEARAGSRVEQHRLEADLGDLTLDLEAVPRVRLSRQPALYGAVLLGGAGALCQQAVGWEPVTYAVLGAGTLLAGFVAYRAAAASQQRRGLEQRIAVLRADHAAVAERVERDHAATLDAVHATGAASVDAFLGRRERHRVLTAKRERLEAAARDLLEGDPPEALHEEIARVEAWITELEDTLTGLRVSGADAEAARREQASVRHALRPEAVAAEAAAGVDVSIEPHLEAEPALRGALDQRRESYCARAGDYLARFTGGEFTRLTVNGSYRPTLHTERDSNSSGRPGAGMVDLIYLAQYLAMIETLDPTGRFPLVLDEPFLNLDPERRTLLYDSLRELARQRQVVIFTCQQFLTSPGDHLVRLKG
jgi:hypothetical protein